jgi:hypothetical protein
VASDVWKSKPVREWSAEETRNFLRNSLWVHQVSAGGGLVEPGPPAELSTQTRPGRGESSGASGREASPQIEAAPGGMPSGPTYFIEWSSAKVVRQAGLHFAVLQGRAKEEGGEPPALPSYVLTVGAPDLSAFTGADEAELKTAAYLRPKRAKTKVAPAEVKILKAQNGRIAVIEFSFPREAGGQPVISEQEKSVEFYCRFKGLQLRTNFDVAKMTSERGRDL